MKISQTTTPCAIGVRGHAETISLAIVEGSQKCPRLIVRQVLEAPAGSSMPEVLATIRKQFLALIEQYNATRVGIRLPEPNARGNKEGTRNRTRMDGMLLEVAGTLRLNVVYGSLTTIAKALGIKNGKKHLEEEDFHGLPLSALANEMREAILVAVAALPREEGK